MADSFAQKVREELLHVTRMAPHCRKAQQSARRLFSRESSERFEPKKDCCIRAFIRGAFIEAGTISDPARSYHFEITCPDEYAAVDLLAMLEKCGLEPKEMLRKNNIVVYIKEGRQIKDLLTLMGAPISMMAFENERILREVRGGVNRRVNCETGNSGKTVAAGVKQIRAIRSLQENGTFDGLSDALQDVAYARLENPEASMEEIGQLVIPPVSKSCVNHRMRKILELAGVR